MNAEQLVGAWTLDAVWAEDDDGARMHPLGERPRGVLLYAREGLFSVTVTAAERPVFEAPDILLGSPAENARAAETCLAYAGRWSLRAGRVCGLGLYGLDIIESPRGPFVVDLNYFPGYKGVPNAAPMIADYIDAYAKGDVTLRPPEPRALGAGS